MPPGFVGCTFGLAFSLEQPIVFLLHMSQIPKRMDKEQNHQYACASACDPCCNNGCSRPEFVPGSVDIGNRGDEACERV